MKKLYSQFANIKLNKNYNFKNSRGEYIIPVGDKYNSIDHIVYIRGTNRHPIICKVVEFNKHKDLAEEIVREIIDYESSKYCTDAYKIYEAYAGEEIFTVHTLYDYIEYSEARYGTGKQNNKGTPNENRKWSERDRNTDIGERKIPNDSTGLKFSDRNSENSLTENKSVKASPIREGQEASLKNSGNALTDETRIPQNGTDVNTSISEKGVKYSEQIDIRYSDRDYDKAFMGKEKALLYSKVKNLQMKNNYEYGDMDFALIDTDDAQNDQKLVVLNANVDGELNIKNVYLLEDSYYNIHEENLAVEAIRVLERSGYNDVTIAKVFKSYNFDGREPICRRYSVKSGRFNRLGNRNSRKSGKNVQTGNSAKSNRGTSPQGNGNNVSLKRSDRDPDALTPRNLLANALESSAVHEVEKKKLAEYKANIEKLYEKEQELYEVRKEIKELSFAPGKKDTAKIKKLQEKAVKLSNSVTFYDKKLLNLESTSFLKNVLEREKSKAMKRQKEKDAEILKRQKEKALQKEKEITERYQASRKKAVESRNKTAMRNKIKRVVNELNQYLLSGNKDKHVMDNMKKVVAEALNIIDMDTVGADERVERYNQLIAEATDPDVIASLTETRDRIQGQGDKLHDKLMSLKNVSRFKT